MYTAYITSVHFVYYSIISSPQREPIEEGGVPEVEKSPLECLEDALGVMTTDQSYLLKRELLVGIVPETPQELRAVGVVQKVQPSM